MVFNTTFNNISVISWWSVLLVEETGVPEENHGPVASHWDTFSHNVVSITPRHKLHSNSQGVKCIGCWVVNTIRSPRPPRPLVHSKTNNTHSDIIILKKLALNSSLYTEHDSTKKENQLHKELIQNYNNTNIPDRRCRDRMVVGSTTTYAINAYHHWCCEFKSRSGRGVQHYMIKFVSDLRQVGGFLPVLRLPPPIELSATI
jgi:hypothetical protein